MRYDLVLNSFTKDAFVKGTIIVNAGGDMLRPFVDIQDVAWAYAAALELPDEKVGGKIFNVVRENRKIKDVAEEFVRIIKERTGKEIALDVKPFEPVYHYQADNSAFARTFGFLATRPLDDAIMEIWNQLAAGHDWENKKYYNDVWHFEALRLGLI